MTHQPRRHHLPQTVASPLHASLKLSDSLSWLGLTLKLSLSVSLISLSLSLSLSVFEQKGKKRMRKKREEEEKGGGGCECDTKKKNHPKKSLRALIMAYEISDHRYLRTSSRFPKMDSKLYSTWNKFCSTFIGKRS
jgi:hypothetical protein